MKRRGAGVWHRNGKVTVTTQALYTNMARSGSLSLSRSLFHSLSLLGAVFISPGAFCVAVGFAARAGLLRPASTGQRPQVDRARPSGQFSAPQHGGPLLLSPREKEALSTSFSPIYSPSVGQSHTIELFLVPHVTLPTLFLFLFTFLAGDSNARDSHLELASADWHPNHAMTVIKSIARAVFGNECHSTRVVL